MIWAQGTTEGGSLGQLCETEEAAERWCDLIDSVSRRPVRWQLVEVTATESRAAHAEAQDKLRQETS